jgi:hypothetical protein
MIVSVTLLVTGMTLTGCSKPASTGGSGPTGPSAAGPSGDGPTDSASPAASEDPTKVYEFTVDGAGPYQLDETLVTLRAAGLDQINAGAAPCPNNTTARGTGKWKDLLLSFHGDGTLYMVTNRAIDLPTPSGVYLGTPVAQVKKIYAGITGQDLTRGGGNPAYLVTTLSGRGILFELDPGGNVSTMRAGESSYLKAGYLGGALYC